MSALQHKISAFRRPPSARRSGPRRSDPCALNLPNSDRAVASHSVSEDWVVVQQALSGDYGSQDKLFAAHTARLYRTAFAVLRNKEDAEDAVQDGLCSAYAKLRSFEGRSSFSTWLTRIVINSALMNRRRKVARPEISLDQILSNQEGWLAQRIVDMRSDPEELCSCTEIYGFVEKEIQRLPEKTQRAFRLHEIDGLSTTESSRVLGINKNGFKSQMFRARRKLKDALQRLRLPPVQTVIGQLAAGMHRRHDLGPTDSCAIGLKASPRQHDRKRKNENKTFCES
jgi:RNA polymerase sigma-70 factor, ECF subfamily